MSIYLAFDINGMFEDGEDEESKRCRGVSELTPENKREQIRGTIRWAVHARRDIWLRGNWLSMAMQPMLATWLYLSASIIIGRASCASDIRTNEFSIDCTE